MTWGLWGYDSRTAARTAMPAPTPDGITFTPFEAGSKLSVETSKKMGYKPEAFGIRPGVAAHLDGNLVGHIEWYPSDWHHSFHGTNNEVAMVATHDRNLQRHGIATALYDYAKQNVNPDLRHSPVQTGLGSLWSKHEESRKASRTANRDPFQHGGCIEYAHALKQRFPQLQLGTLTTPDDEDDWQHVFMHDGKNTYDSAGTHPMPYHGVGGQWEPHDDADFDWYDEPEPGLLAAAHKHIERNGIGPRTAARFHDPEPWNLLPDEGDGMVTLYHRTHPDSADAIVREQKMRSKADGEPIWFVTHPDGQPGYEIGGNTFAEEYGPTVIKVRVPVERVWHSGGFAHKPGEVVHAAVFPENMEGVKFTRHAHRIASRTAMPTWYHLTDDPDFTLDPHHEPTSLNGPGGAGVFLTQRPDEWAYDVDGGPWEWSGDRPYVAEVDAPVGLHMLPGTWHDPDSRRDDDEMVGAEEIFVPGGHFHELRVKNVRPRKARTMNAAAVTVYTKPSCVQCDMTKRLLERMRVKHTTVDVTADPDAHAYVTGLGYQSAPVVVVGDGVDHWAGFKPDRLRGLAG